MVRGDVRRERRLWSAGSWRGSSAANASPNASEWNHVQDMAVTSRSRVRRPGWYPRWLRLMAASRLERAGISLSFPPSRATNALPPCETKPVPSYVASQATGIRSRVTGELKFQVRDPTDFARDRMRCRHASGLLHDAAEEAARSDHHRTLRVSRATRLSARTQVTTSCLLRLSKHRVAGSSHPA